MIIIIVILFFQNLPYAFSERYDVLTPKIHLCGHSKIKYNPRIECLDDGIFKLFGPGWRKFVKDNLSSEARVLSFIQEYDKCLYVTAYKKMELNVEMML